MAKVTALRTLERLNRPTDEGMADPQIKRLFDETRDSNETVREDDWHPSPDPDVAELDAWDTLAARRRWYMNLVEDGSLCSRRSAGIGDQRLGRSCGTRAYSDSPAASRL